MKKIQNKTELSFYVAHLTLNKIDDLFEYRFKGLSLDQLQKRVHEILDNYTKELGRIHNEN